MASASPSDEHSGDDSSTGLKLGLNPAGFDFNDEDDDLEKEFLHEDDTELLEYQKQRSTPKIFISEFEGEDERSAAFKEM